MGTYSTCLMLSNQDEDWECYLFALDIVAIEEGKNAIWASVYILAWLLKDFDTPWNDPFISYFSRAEFISLWWISFVFVM